MKNLRFILIFLILLPFQGNVQLQTSSKLRLGDTTQVHVLSTIRGDVFQGILIHFDVSDVVFLLEKKDTLRYKPSDIDSVYILPKMKNREHLTIRERLLVSPTGFGLDKGENEYRNAMFLYNAYHHGITDNISVGGGIMPLFFINTSWVDAKVSFELDESIHVSTGAICGGGFVYNFPEDDQESWLKFGYIAGFGALTIGSKENFINLSMARIAVSSDGEKDSSPWLYSVGGSYKISGKLRLFLEAGNYAGSFNEWSFGLGITTMYKGNSFDAGMVFFPGGEPRMLPALAFATRF